MSRRTESAGVRRPQKETREESSAMGQVLLFDLPVDSPVQPPCDVTESCDAVRVRIELPGVPSDAVEVRVTENRIEVWGEKAADFPGEETSYHCLERIFGRFRRVFEVQGSVNLSGVTACLSNGILVVTIPKIPERRGRARRIPVVTG